MASRMVHGTGTPKDGSVNAIAEALRVRPAVVYELVGLSVPAESGPWQPPAEAARLTINQRDALTQLIRTMVAAETDQFKEAIDHNQRSYELAANKGTNQGRAIHDAAGARGEESQDTADDH